MLELGLPVMAFHVLVSYIASTLHLTRSTSSIVSRDLQTQCRFDQTCFYSGPGVVISTSTCCFPLAWTWWTQVSERNCGSYNNDKVFFDQALNAGAALLSQQQSWEDHWDL